jgi:hypothetical protein
MSDFSTIYDGWVSRIGTTLLPNHKRLPNPYDIAENNEIYLAQGWGLSVGPSGVNTQRFVCNKRSLQVTLQLSITRKFYAVEHDATKKASVDKQLMADFEAVFDDAHANNLGLDSNLTVVSGFFGIQNVKPEKDLFRALIANLAVEYFRQ